METLIDRVYPQNKNPPNKKGSDAETLAQQRSLSQNLVWF